MHQSIKILASLLLCLGFAMSVIGQINLPDPVPLTGDLKPFHHKEFDGLCSIWRLEEANDELSTELIDHSLHVYGKGNKLTMARFFLDKSGERFDVENDHSFTIRCGGCCLICIRVKGQVYLQYRCRVSKDRVELFAPDCEKFRMISKDGISVNISDLAEQFTDADTVQFEKLFHKSPMRFKITTQQKVTDPHENPLFLNGKIKGEE